MVRFTHTILIPVLLLQQLLIIAGATDVVVSNTAEIKAVGLLPSLNTKKTTSTSTTSHHRTSKTSVSSTVQASKTLGSSSILITSTEHSSKVTSLSKSTNSLPSFKSSTSKNSLPSFKSSSATSSASSSTHYTFKAAIPTAESKNPFISKSSAANGTVFISMGAVLGSIFLVFFGFLSFSFLISRMRKTDNTQDLFDDYEDKNFSYDPSIFGGGAKNLTGTTVMDFDSKNMMKSGAVSISSLSGESAVSSSNILLLSDPFNSTTQLPSQQGRSLMNALLHHNGSQQALNTTNRKSRVLSMYISPLEQAMNQSNLGLQPPASSFDPNSSSISNTPTTGSSSFPSTMGTPHDDSPLLPMDEMKSHTRKSSGLDLYDMQLQDVTEKKKIRPPSMYLNELMDASVDDRIDIHSKGKNDDDGN